MERFGDLENYEELDKAIFNTLSPLSSPSMHAIVWCNMGLANHPKRKIASCIHPSPYLLQAFKYLLKMKPKPPP
jgi:hypothetical protein